ncbi:arylesterase [Pseudodesulfovibrio sp. zrk46]|uniref:arylesterase n=1 Tax=Pseudodesulfovibrio sp. zrk46 TaxID=2725288 RepID=UPI001449ED75|nr:arylesterase [Pseudodesulfovibrio sp. zrk46]QJB58027.1 arylesterase [Pseudodesulfovibrio sp. zrk46]
MSHEPIRIACFGDSLTEGYGLHSDEALPVVLEDMMRDEGVRVTCLNYGISGDTAGDGLNRIDAVVAANPDAVIIEFGANDCFVGDSIEEITANLTAIIERFRALNLPMLIVGISAMTIMDEDYKAQFDPIFGNLAEKYDIPLFPDILSCYFGNSTLTLMDGMHPNAQGVQAIARGVLPQALELAKRAQS